MASSLVLAEQIELLGGGVPSAIPACAGAIFMLARDFDLGAPNPAVDVLAALTTDGEIPYGRRASNRSPHLGVRILVRPTGNNLADQLTLSAAREFLLHVIDAPQWTLRWTRDGSGLPMILDCYRAAATVVNYSVLMDKNLVSDLVISFSAAPYGRSDVPVTVDFASPLAGRPAPPSPVTVDNYSAVVSPSYLTGDGSTFEGGTASWVGTGNCTIAQSAAQAHGGTKSLALTSTAAGNMSAGHVSNLLLGMPASPGDVVTVTGWLRAAVSARSVQAGVQWADGTGTSISTSFGSTVTDSTTGWTQVTATATAPAATATVRARMQVVSTGAGGEVHYADDVTVSAQWSQSAIGPGPNSARWSPASAPALSPSGAGATPVYTRSGIGPLNLTGLAALTVWAGFGSTSYFHNFARLGGHVVFTFTLTDGTHSVSFHKTRHIKGSNDSLDPLWHKVRVPIPQTSAVNLAAVTGYTIKVTNRAAGDLFSTDLYLDSLTAVPPTTSLIAPQRGVVYDLAGIVGNARRPASWQFQQPGTVTVTKSYSTPGTFAFTPPAGVTTADVTVIGAGGFAGGGNGTGGGGGGERAEQSAYALTPGSPVAVVVPPPTQAGGTAQLASFGTLTAMSGSASPAFGTAGGTGGTGGTGTATSRHAGGAGGAGDGSGGGGGGGSGGTSANGNAGGNAVTTTGGAGGTAVTGGYAGGAGGNNTLPGHTPTGYGGGGGGPGAASGILAGNGLTVSGAPARVSVSYQAPATAKTLIAHRPSSGAPENLTPFVSPGPSDLPDGNTEYPVQPLNTTLNARLSGTYSVVAVALSFGSAGSSRDLFATVTQYEQPGGASYQVSTKTRTFTPSNLVSPEGNGIVLLGEVTLPLKDIPPENLAAYYTLTITDTNTADRFLDILLLDTEGETVIINGSTGYSNYYIDAPGPDSDIGRVMGSVFDRTSAISVLDTAAFSGPPPGVDPSGNQSLLVYAAEGAPSAQLVYHPGWHLDRQA